MKDHNPVNENGKTDSEVDETSGAEGLGWGAVMLKITTDRDIKVREEPSLPSFSLSPSSW